MDLFDLAAQNLFSPPILFFVLGLTAALVRSDLALPESISKALSLYLVMAIGFKGGIQLAENGVGGSVIGLLFAAIALSALLPLVSFAMLRTTTKIGMTDCAAIAAHYGSISIVTFIAATDAVRALDLAPGGAMVAAAAAMEAPAILTGLLLANHYRQKSLAAASLSSAVAPEPESRQSQLIKKCLTNGSIVLLVGAFFVGMIAGPSGMAPVEPFFVDMFRGVLCLFLLDMGITAGRGLLGNARSLEPSLIAHGLYMPPIGAAAGLAAAMLLGLAPADGALLMTLSASASYIAVPAAMRLALPDARASLSLTLSLGVTFPFNLILGIPAYIAVAQFLL